jgi:hypothetical protein
MAIVVGRGAALRSEPSIHRHWRVSRMKHEFHGHERVTTQRRSNSVAIETKRTLAIDSARDGAAARR